MASSLLHYLVVLVRASGLVFVKTHRTGSSTIAGILHRYCDRHEQRCFTPLRYPPGRLHTRKDLEEIVAQGITADIWANHVVFDPDLLPRVVAKPRYFSIFRDPVDRWVSAYANADGSRPGEGLLDALRENRSVCLGSSNELQIISATTSETAGKSFAENMLDIC